MGQLSGYRSMADLESVSPQQVTQRWDSSADAASLATAPEAPQSSDDLRELGQYRDELETAGRTRDGRYEVLGEIARGGMGSVFRVRDVSFNRTLAMKVLLESLARRADIEMRFLDEAQLSAQLQHPGVAPVHEVGRLADGRPFFTMKLIEGRTLSSLLAARPSPKADLPGSLKVFEQIAQAIAYAHAQGVIHRDLKPLNVMVGAFGEVQVMDWGLAKRLTHGSAADGVSASPAAINSPTAPGTPETAVVESDTDRGDLSASRTHAGAVLGTFAYMAPEQARGEVETLDARCDVFGLGAILCAMLTGEPPYRARSSYDAWRQAHDADLTDAWRRLGACGADEELLTLTTDCLAPAAVDRPRDAGQVADRIAVYLAGVQARLESARMAQAQAEVKAAEERKRRRLTLSLAAAVLALLGGASAFGVWYVNDQAQREQDRRVREAERSTRADYLAREVKAALDEARAFRERLDFVDPPKAALLMSDLYQWQTLVESAQAALKRAETLAEGGRHLLPPDLTSDMTALGEQLTRDEANRLLAVKLDQIRFEASSPDATGGFQLWRASPKIAAAFSEAGYDIEGRSARATADQIKKSGIGLPLVAALDFWANVTRDVRLREKLMEVARLADPDRWRDQVRSTESWRDNDAIKRLAAEVDPSNQTPQLLAALSLRVRHADGDSPEFLRRALVAHPRDFWLFFELGHASKDPTEQVGAFRSAVSIRPNSGYAHYGLGVVLQGEGQLDLARQHYERAVALEQAFASVWNNLGMVLHDLGRPEEAVPAYERAVALDSDSAASHANLAGALKDLGRLEEALQHARRAMECDPDYVPAYVNQGVVLRVMNRVDEAIASFERALQLAPDNPWALCNLGHALTQSGRLEEGLEALRRGHECGLRIPQWSAPSAEWVKEAELRIAAKAKLPAILNGEAPPEGAEEQLALANLCLMQEKRFAAAARFFAGAFAADEKLADDLLLGYRYNASCAAARAVGGQGVDGSTLSDDERATLRRQALDWLKADLQAWRDILQSQPDRAGETVTMLSHWRRDPDLANLREDAALDKLPGDDEAEWDKLWSDVAELRGEAAGKHADPAAP